MLWVGRSENKKIDSQITEASQMNEIQNWIRNMSFINSESKPGSECISSARENEQGTLFIELFHSRTQKQCKFIRTAKESVNKRKRFNAYRVGFVSQHGQSFIVWELRDVRRKHSISSAVGLSVTLIDQFILDESQFSKFSIFFARLHKFKCL